MARHFSIHIRLSRAEFPDVLLTALGSPGTWRPVSLDGVEQGHDGDHWFLSGYAVEDFLERFVVRTMSAPASVEVVPAGDGCNRAYLDAAAARVRKAAADSGRDLAARVRDARAAAVLSPFETPSAPSLLTLFGDRQLGSAEISRCGDWFARHPRAGLYAYGAVDLVLAPPVVTPGPVSVFQELTESGQPGEPVLLVRAGAAPLAEGIMEITLRAQSTHWLEETNLQRFAALSASVLRAGAQQVVSASLEVAGGPFLREEPRIQAALAPLLGHTPANHS